MVHTVKRDVPSLVHNAYIVPVVPVVPVKRLCVLVWDVKPSLRSVPDRRRAEKILAAMMEADVMLAAKPSDPQRRAVIVVMGIGPGRAANLAKLPDQCPAGQPLPHSQMSATFLSIALPSPRLPGPGCQVRLRHDDMHAAMRQTARSNAFSESIRADGFMRMMDSSASGGSTWPS